MSGDRPAPQHDAHRSAEPDSLPDADQDGPSQAPRRPFHLGQCRRPAPNLVTPVPATRMAEGEPPDRAQNPVTEEGTRTEVLPPNRVRSAPTRDEQASVAGEELSLGPVRRRIRMLVPPTAGTNRTPKRRNPARSPMSPGYAGSTSETATTARPWWSPARAPGDPESQEDRSTTESLARADKPPGGNATEPSGARERPGRSNNDRPRRPPSPPAAGLDRMRQARSASDDRQDGRQGTATERNPSRGRTDDDKGPDV